MSSDEKCQRCGDYHRQVRMPTVKTQHHQHAKRLADLVISMCSTAQGLSTATVLMTAGYLLKRASIALSVPEQLWGLVGVGCLDHIDEHEHDESKRAARAKEMC